MKMVLLSHVINEDTPLYGGQQKVKFSSEKAISRGDANNSLSVLLTTHTSTHVDVPYHFLQTSSTLTDYTSEAWCFSGIRIKEVMLDDKNIIDEQVLSDIPYDRKTDFLIIRTGMEQKRMEQDYIHNSPVVKSTLAKFLKEKLPNLKCVGFDFISLSSLKNRDEGRQAHRTFLECDIRIIEDMHIQHLSDTPDRILVSPLFIEKADGAPVTIWAMYDSFDLHKTDYVFFDCDGVILDSVHIKTEAFKEMYLPHGEEIAAKAVQHHEKNGGISRFQKFKLYHKEFLGVDLSPAEIDELAEEFAQLVLDKVLKAPFIPGAMEFLDTCHKAGKQCFLVTGTPEDEILKIMQERGLKKYFTDIKGAPQSKEDIMRDMIQHHHVDVHRAVFFGDSVNDHLAANAHSVRFVGIQYHDAVISYQNFEPLLHRSFS